jgi:GT2 family glycosyltransferase
VPDARPPTISVVVPTFRRPDALARTLGGLLAADYPGDHLQILVVDDGPDDATRDAVAAFRGVRYLRQANSGAATARNHGAREATGELVVFVDNDILVGRDHLHRHVDSWRACGVRSIVGAHWEFPDELRARFGETPFGRFRLALEDGFKAPAGEGLDESVGPTTASMAVARAVFWELGGFDEGFPHAGAEDRELLLRARAAGCRIVYDRSNVVLHYDGYVDLAGLCSREAKYAATRVHFAETHPGAIAKPPTRPLARIVLGPLGRPAGRRAAQGAISVLERAAPDSTVLHRAYGAMIAAAIHRGTVEERRRRTRTAPAGATARAS